MTQDETSRRRYLAAVGAAGATGLAGCIGPFWEDDDGSRVIRDYWDAIDNGEFEQANAFLHPNDEERDADPIELPGDVGEDEVAESEIMSTFDYRIDEELEVLEEEYRSVLTLQVTAADTRRALERTVVFDAQSRLTTSFDEWRYFSHEELNAEDLEALGLEQFAGNDVDDLRFLSPSATFEADDRTISHAGGDALLANELFISGQGILIDDEDIENLEDVTWVEAGGEATGEIEGEPAVQEGDSITLEVDEDAFVSLANLDWRSADDPRSQTLQDGVEL